MIEGGWREVAIVAAAPVTPRVRRLSFRVDWAGHFRPGQHVDVRLTAPDGYQAQRSYSIASAPDASGCIDLLIEALPDGEVSGYFTEVAHAGDTIEMRGPIGAFTWRAEDGGPLLLVGGGSGVVPLLSMLRHRAMAAPAVPALLLYSARTRADVIEDAELDRRARAEPGFQLRLVLTREGGRRVDAAAMAEVLSALPHPAHAFVCGANPFVGAMADLLVDAGLPPGIIRTERFGG